MKYYEIVAENWEMSPSTLTIKEVTVVKETEKQLRLTGSLSYSSHFNKSRLCKLQDLGTSRVYIIYPEDKENEALTIMREHLERSITFHQRKLNGLNNLIQEVNNLGKKEHN